MTDIKIGNFYTAVSTVVAVNSNIADLAGQLAQRTPSFGDNASYYQMQRQVESAADAITAAAKTFESTSESLRPAASNLVQAAAIMRDSRKLITGPGKHSAAGSELHQTINPMVLAVQAALKYCEHLQAPAAW